MPSSACKTCARSEEHTSELQSHDNLVCRLLLEKNDRVAQLRERSPDRHVTAHPSAEFGARLADNDLSPRTSEHPQGFLCNEAAPRQIPTLPRPDAIEH